MATANEKLIVSKTTKMVDDWGLTLWSRVGHYIEPTVGFRADLPNVPILPDINHDVNISTIPVAFIGWQKSDKKWKEWYDKMHAIYGNTWKVAGIYEALRNSTVNICQKKDTILALAKKWSPGTNTFVLKWGEVGITLEDICVLGGYSVVGESIWNPPDRETREMNQALHSRLSVARNVINGGTAKKVTHSRWVDLLTKGDTFTDIEHEAFLVYWLSKFVFPEAAYVVGTNVHMIAIRLARGTKIALAPAILAALYREMTALRNTISSNVPPASKVKLYSRLHLVQIWAWERFSLPNPNQDTQGSIMARWHDVKPLKKDLSDIYARLENQTESFCWRPYVRHHDFNDLTRTIYPSYAERILDLSELDPILEAYIKILRPSDLLGLKNCTEKYLPHRVARQFGYDQDIPSQVDHVNQNSPLAYFNRPSNYPELYIPAREFEGRASDRYMEWWTGTRTGSEAGSSSDTWTS